MPSHKPQATSHKPQATSHKPQATSHKPQATSHKPHDRLKLTPLAVALLACLAVFTQQPAFAVDADQNQLPDLGSTTGQTTTSVRPSPSGVAFESNFDRKKIIITPEYSNQTGSSIAATLATMLGDDAAVGVILSAGAAKNEALINAGFRLDNRQRFVVTAGQLEQFLDYTFRSGVEKVGMTQNSAALSYQLELGSEFLRFLEVNGYASKTDSRELAGKTFSVDTATLYELWNEPRRIAGSTITGLQTRLGFSPMAGSVVKVSLGQERLSYDLFTGADNVNRFTGGLEWLHDLGSGYQFKMAADSFASQSSYTLGLQRSLPGNDGHHNIGINLVNLRGRDGLGDDNQIKLTYAYLFGAAGKRTATTAAANSPSGAPPGQANPGYMQAMSRSGTHLLSQVAQRPSFIPSHVVAKVDTTTTPIRLIAIDKTALPAGSSVNPATGDVTAPLGVAVTGIAGVTKNLLAFTNAGQFSLNGNSLVVKPNLIVQPAVGVVDSYVVTVNNLGGGTSLITVLVSRGSVKIDSITITAGSADTTAPVTTAAPSVSATTNTATTLSVNINEAGTGYYLVQTAAAAAPTVAAVQAGTAFAMTANVAATPAISGLTNSTAYKIYFVAKDAANNVQAAVQSVAVTTSADVTPPAAPTGLALNSGAASTTNTSVSLNGLTTPPDADLAAWFVSESSTAPAAGVGGWSSTKPTSYTFATATNETKTVCVYVKDTSNNVQTTGACDTIDKVP